MNQVSLNYNNYGFIDRIKQNNGLNFIKSPRLRKNAVAVGYTALTRLAHLAIHSAPETTVNQIRAVKHFHEQGDLKTAVFLGTYLTIKTMGNLLIGLTLSNEMYELAEAHNFSVRS